MSDLVATRTLRFILVHGTWGRGFFSKWIEPRTVASDDAARPITSPKRLRWFDAGSDFRKELTDALKNRQLSFTTRVFLWDGANSIASRNKAATSLATQLEELAIEHPNDPILIVAHSHGGNVALRAAHIAGKPSIENLRVITLATPFLQIRTYTSFYDDDGDVGVSFDTPYLKDVIPILVEIISALIVLLAIIFTSQAAFATMLGGWLVLAWVGVLFLSEVITRRVMKLIVNPFPTYEGIWGKYDSSPEGWAYKPDQLASLSYYSMPQTDCDWLLVLRGVDDEASLTLAAGAIGNRMTHFFLGRFLPIAAGMLALVVIVGWIFGASWLRFVLGADVLLGVIATLVFLLPGCFRRVFGRELLLGCWRCEIFADSAPDTIGGGRVKTFLRAGSGGGGLRHALYENPEVVPYIAAWLTASVQGRRSELAD
jgi:hypothetical protein